MANALPSIFNDVIGPVMRGPSSSHVAGAHRIASLIRMAAGEKKIVRAECEFDVNGTQVETYHGHGSDIGFVCGILGIELTDPRAAQALKCGEESPVDIEFTFSDFGAKDPTVHRVHIKLDDGSTHIWQGITSMGGGMIEIYDYDGFSISLCGDYYEILVRTDGKEETHAACEKNAGRYEKKAVCKKENEALLSIKYHIKPDEAAKAIKTIPGVKEVLMTDPVLPTLSSADCKVPYVSAEETLAFVKEHPAEMWELAEIYESARGGCQRSEVREKMRAIVRVMRDAVEAGLKGTEYEDRVLGPQSHLIREGEKKKRITMDPIVNRIIESVSAIMEVKSSYGVYVAAPTGGSGGCLPGTLIGVQKALDLDEETLVNGMLAAGLVGVYIAHFSCFGGDIGSCQVECGSGGAMAAAGITCMMGGTPEMCMDAAALALHGVTGLGCDPVACRVEVPCLEKNIMCGVNALACSNMALAGYDKVIPLDESIQAIAEISPLIPIELRSVQGGLGNTKTSLEIRKRLR